jgi:hypothetical protein
MFARRVYHFIHPTRCKTWAMSAPRSRPYISRGFRYDPLKEGRTSFRLVTLFPGHHSDAVCCSLRSSSLNSIEDFEALSYSWGDHNRTMSITLDGQIFGIPYSIHSALLQLRDPEMAKTLWIDAICINQNDNIEKGLQVARMGDVYRSARAVTVWLGESAEDSDLAMDLLDRISAFENENISSAVGSQDITTKLDANLFAMLKSVLTRNMWHMLWRHAWYFGKTPVTLRAGHIKAQFLFGERPWLAMKRFLHRPWWRRTWVVQEAFLAKELVFRCGAKALPADTIFNGLRNFRELAMSCQEEDSGDTEICTGITFIQPYLNLLPEYQKFEHPPRLLFLLYQFRLALATDQRDRIYGLLGLTLKEEILSNQPDYDMDVATVYTRLARASIQDTGSLDVLSFVHVPKFAENIPTWVPDWTTYSPLVCNANLPISLKDYIHPGPEILIQSGLKDGTRVFNASQGTASNIHYIRPLDDKIFAETERSVERKTSNTHFLLPLEGIVIDTIDYIGTPVDNSSGSGVNVTLAQILNEYHLAACDVPFGPSFVYKSLESRNLSFWRTVTADRAAYSTRFEKEAYSDLVETMQTFWRKSDSSQSGDYLNGYVRAACGLRRFFTTKNRGFMGLAPYSAQQGDLVCVLFGGQVPFIVRRESQDERSFLVGEAYVDGVMDGEAVDELNSLNMASYKRECFLFV